MKIVSAILGIALVAAAGTAIHLWREVASGQQRIADLKTQLLEREARSAVPAIAPANQAAASIAVASPPTTAPAATSASATVRPDPVILPPALEAMRAQMSSPEAMARTRQLRRTMVETAHPYIAEALGLAPDEAEKLLDLLAAHQEDLSKLLNSNAEANGSVTLEERRLTLQQRQQANDAELQAMLGGKYAQWQDYRETLPIWQQMRDLRAVATAGGIPLTDAQARSLTAALSAEQRIFNQQSRDAANQGSPAAGALARNTPERNQRLLDVAAAYLTPQQLESYRGMLERTTAREQALLAPLRARQSEAEAQER